jgi:hypothetical protein
MLRLLIFLGSFIGIQLKAPARMLIPSMGFLDSIWMIIDQLSLLYSMRAIAVEVKEYLIGSRKQILMEKEVFASLTNLIR